jgi:hypothetical protein
LQDSQWLKLDLRPEKVIAYLAPFIICPTKEKKQKSDDVHGSYTRKCKFIQKPLPRNLKYAWALMG